MKTHPLRKTATLYKNAGELYMDKVAGMIGGLVPEIDYGQQVDLGAATRLFTNDPNLADHPYARDMGTAIVTNAAMMANTNRPTLGGILDSAVQKISNKLTLGGIAQVGLKSMVANGAARLFTGALGQMVDLSPAARNNLVSAGTWAGAISAILE